MEHPAYAKLMELAGTEEALAASVQYLTDKLTFIKPKEQVLICFTRNQPLEIGSLFEKAVLARDAVPVFWEKDYRWKTLLRQAFSNRVTTVIGPPMVVLGLAKIARFNATPLNIRNVVTAGYPCVDWMIDGIIKCLDCETWGCFTPGGRLICGFSCGKSRGVHLREDVYGIELLDGEGKTCAAGSAGEMVLYPKADPAVRYPVGEKAKMETTSCPCGCQEIRLMDMQPGESTDLQLDPLGQRLLSWTSVLDCRLRKGTYGLELEMIVFPGEKLPELPSASRRVIRPWDPEKDEPFYYIAGLKNN